jgi:nicotinic acid phosphoribosyltransferase
MEDIKISKKLLQFKYDDNIEISPLNIENFEKEKLLEFLERMKFPSIIKNVKEFNNLNEI